MFLQIQNIGKNEWWRWLVVILFVVMGVFIGQMPMLVAAVISGNHIGIDSDEAMRLVANNELEAVGLSLNFALLLLVLGFVGGLVGLWFGVKFLHQRQFKTLITPLANINWKKVLFSFGLWMGLAVVVEFIYYLMSPENYSLHFQPGKFVGLLLVSVLFLPLQTSFEEIFFRGYLMQGFAQLIPFKWVPLLLTSLLFGGMHFMNPEVQAFGIGVTMAYYIGVGLFLGIITLIDDSLELALGVHAATNIFSAVFVTFDDSVLPTAALFHTSQVDMPLMLGGFVAAAIIYTIVVARKYKWRDWSKIYGRMERPHLNEV